MALLSWLRGLADGNEHVRSRSRSAARRSPGTTRRPTAFRPQLEQLMDRIVPAVSAISLNATTGVLTVSCNNVAPFDVVFSIAGANVLVNGAATGATVGFLGTLNSVVVNGGKGSELIDAHVLPVFCILNGGAGDDILFGGSVGDILSGGSDNDVLRGSGGNDSLNGGPGTDRVDERGPDSFQLDSAALLGVGLLNPLGLDGLTSIEEASLTCTNAVFGVVLDVTNFPGNVTLRGGNGNDVLRGGVGDDILDGGAGNDQLFGNDGTDTLTGGAGNDTIGGGNGVDTLKELRSSPTNKVITLTNATFQVNDAGTSEVDSLTAINTAEITVPFGNNTINAAAFTSPATLNGGSGIDNLTGGSGADVINGNGGNDLLQGSAGADTINGGAGDDLIQGGTGADQLNGGDNNDSLFGFTTLDFTDSSADIMNGEAGDDFGSGNDSGDVFNQGTGIGGLAVVGTNGDDVIVVSRRVGPNGAEAVLIINGVETSVQYTNGQTIRVFSGPGNDIVVIDESTAVTWSAQLYGEVGRDLLVGASRGDYLNGGAGDDTLMGRAGDDTLIGGEGHDQLFGGAGADIIQAVGGGIDWIYADALDFVAHDNNDHLIWV